MENHRQREPRPSKWSMSIDDDPAVDRRADNLRNIEWLRMVSQPNFVLEVPAVSARPGEASAAK